MPVMQVQSNFKGTRVSKLFEAAALRRMVGAHMLFMRNRPKSKPNTVDFQLFFENNLYCHVKVRAVSWLEGGAHFAALFMTLL